MLNPWGRQRTVWEETTGLMRKKQCRGKDRWVLGVFLHEVQEGSWSEEGEDAMLYDSWLWRKI